MIQLEMLTNNFILSANQYITKPPSVITQGITHFLGFFLNFIYNLSSFFGTANSLGIAIILFTIFVRLLMLPLAFKQQHSMTKMQVVQPEIQKIQAKYKGQKDTESQQKMQKEIQIVYAKHKVSPLSGCLPLAVQLPIFFSLTFMMNNAYLYIGKINDIFTNMSTQVHQIPNWGPTLLAICNTKVRSPKAGVALIDLSTPIGMNTGVSKLLPSDWDKLLQGASNDVVTQIHSLQAQLNSIEHFCGIDLTISPGFHLSIALIIPVLAIVTSLASSYLMMKVTPATSGSAAQQQKIMLYLMPLFMGFTTISISAGVGLYWITSSVFQTVQQYFINKTVRKSLAIVETEKDSKKNLLNASSKLKKNK